MQKIRPIKILVMGLPGSGKTTLSKELSKELKAIHINADEVRKYFNDWSFSYENRLNQAKRMNNLSQKINSKGYIAIADFVCPTNETRKIFNADFIVFLDRINNSRYEDTNLLFEKPLNVDVCIKNGYTLKEEINIIKEKLWRILHN